MRVRPFWTQPTSRTSRHGWPGHGQLEAAGLSEVDLSAPGPGENEPEETPRGVTGFAWFLVVLAVISSTFLFALDNTIVADIQPAIVEDLGHIETLPWISVAFAASATGTCLLW